MEQPPTEQPATEQPPVGYIEVTRLMVSSHRGSAVTCCVIFKMRPSCCNNVCEDSKSMYLEHHVDARVARGGAQRAGAGKPRGGQSSKLRFEFSP
jgi:hypothetical protein